MTREIMYDTILVPTDGSDTVDRTIAHALPIAIDNDATIHALSVVDTRIVQAATGDTREEIQTQLEEAASAATAAVAARAEEAGLETVESTERGTPAKTILEYAAESDTNLIVIGTHGKSPREKQITMGSVSERVVDRSPVPVFVVRGADGSS